MKRLTTQAARRAGGTLTRVRARRTSEKWRFNVRRIGPRTIARILSVLVVCAASMGFPGSVLAAEEESAWGVLGTLGRFFNLGVVAAVLIYALRKPLGEFFRERRQDIRKSLEEAKRAKEAAEAKLAEMDRRMQALDSEIATIKENAGRDAAEERRRTLARAAKEAERIQTVAQREAASLVRAAKLELREHAARLAVQLAEEQVRGRLSSETDSRLAENFVQGLGRPQ